jgi:uncharacterized membrane protein
MKSTINKCAYSIYQHRYLAIIVVVFALVYSSISLVNHYNFRTYSLDLGLFNNSFYHYSHFQKDVPFLIKPVWNLKSELGDHFDLLLPILSPLYWLGLGSYSLLVFQIFAILFGGVGIYRFIDLVGSRKLAILATIHFYSMWGIFSALAYDYHENVIAAMLVPWFIYFMYKERTILGVIFFFLIIMAKENMALWAIFINIGLAVLWFKERQRVIIHSILAVIALVWFVFAIKLFIPLCAGHQYIHLNYSFLGNSWPEIIRTILSRPFYVISHLFLNHSGNPDYNWVKTEVHMAVILSGGIVFLRYPQFLIMVIPIYMQKFFTGKLNVIGINNQYSIEFVPIITIALFYAISQWNTSQKKKIGVAILSILICMATNGYTLEKRISPGYLDFLSLFYSKVHYTTEYEPRLINEGLKLIPEEGSVSAQSVLASHLALRDTIYEYPYVNNAMYIALAITYPNIYPISSREDYNKRIDELIESHKYFVYFKNKDVLILKHR